MKKMIVKVAITTGLLFIVSGCGDDTSKKSGAVASSTKASVTVAPKISVEERKATFDKQIKMLSTVGFDIQQTENHYTLHIKESKKATAALLSLINMATLGPRERTLVENAIDGSKVGVTVDWSKYAANSEKSVEVYFMGNGQESDLLTKIITEKKIGAYLTFDGKDSIKKVTFKDIDEKLTKGIEVAHIILKGAKIDIKKTATTASPSKAFTIKGGEFSYTLENNGSKEIAFSYSNPHCEIDKSNAYLGKQTCSFPLIQVDGGTDSDSLSVTFRDSNMMYELSAHNKKIKTDILFKIPITDIKVKDKSDDVIMQLKNFHIGGNSDNMDESLMKEFYTLAQAPMKDINATMKKSMELVGELFSKGVTFDYSVGLESLKGTALNHGKTTEFMMDGYHAKSHALMDKTIEGDTKTTIKHISVTEKGAKAALFDLKGFKFGSTIKDLYNFFPEFMQFAGTLAQKQQSGVAPGKEEEEKMAALGTKVVNNGLSLSFSPLGIDSVAFDAMGQKMSYGKIDFNLDATLAKNNIKFDNPMAAMMLLSFLQADGKLVLSKADLDKMSQQFPPQMIGMVMMFAKYEGDKAIFVLKFEKGHLMVNEKPVM